MKPLLKVAALGLFMLSCLTGCSQGKGYYNQAINDLKSRMKDPNSLIVVDADGYSAKTSDGKTEWACRINYNGKNSYGAYAGASNVYYYLSDGKVSYAGTSSIMYTLVKMLDGAKYEQYA